MVVQWLRLCTPNAWGSSQIPGRGNKILLAAQCGLKTRKAMLPLFLPLWQKAAGKGEIKFFQFSKKYIHM